MNYSVDFFFFLRSLKLLFVVFLFFSACREGKNPHIKNEHVALLNLSCADEKRKQSDIFEIADVISLETQDSVLIDRISAIVRRPSGFYLVDDKVGKQVVKFDSVGRFLFAIHKYGRGPGEFVGITKISVDRYDKYLYLYDNERRQVICYDAGSGDYIRSFPFTYNAYSFSVLPDGDHFIFYCNYMNNNKLKKDDCCPNFIVTDSLGQIEKAFDYFDSKIEMPNLVSRKDVFISCDSILYCFTTYSDKIYSIDKMIDIKPAFMLDYGNDNQERYNKLLKKIGDYGCVDFGKSKEDHIQADAYEMSRMEITGKYVYCVGMHSDNLYSFMYDKISSKAIDLKRLYPDIVGQSLYFMASDHQYFYFSIPVMIIKQLILEEPGGYDSMIVNKVKEMEDDVNPIIVKLRMK